MAMGQLVIKSSGTLTTIQDRGRIGSAFYAFPRSGPMDLESAGLANVLARNDAEAALIECTLVAPKIEFQTHACIVLTGAEFDWRVDGGRVRMRRVVTIPAGSVLEGGKARAGLRGYLAIAGRLNVEEQVGSRASYTYAGLGANGGKPLQAGLELSWEQPEVWPSEIDVLTLPKVKFRQTIGLTAGPEFEWLDEVSKRALFESSFQVSPSSNRMGARLEGPGLSTEGKTLGASVPVLPGIVQLPPSGQPSVVLQDGQTTGGYPRIGFIPGRELDAFNQMPLGESVRFQKR